jgi:3'-5' exoribonuclease
VEICTIASLKQAASRGRLDACLHVQVDALAAKTTRDGKPFYELVLVDGSDRLKICAWNDSPAYSACRDLQAGQFIEVQGEFGPSAAYGVDSRRWSFRGLSREERVLLLAGPPEIRERQEADYAWIGEVVGEISDPRLQGVARLFLQDFGDRFRRAAAARGNHHARRGGLVEHVAQMLRTASAVASVDPRLNRDLLITGVLFHDCGKLWENGLPSDGFQMPYDERGELLGHISIGIELFNGLWRKLMAGQNAGAWEKLAPGNEDVRLHVLHLIAAHHGELQFGSPVPPKTPEAWALHYIDNLDAKLEMLHAGYSSAEFLAPRIQQRVWPLPGNLVKPLPVFVGEDL